MLGLGIYKPVEQWQSEHKGPPAKRRNASSVYTVREMEEATSSFSEENLLGKGGFGRVYKGTLKSGQVKSSFSCTVVVSNSYLKQDLVKIKYLNSQVVAIKKMELPPFKAAEGEREFRVEVDILSRLDHPNLVNLIGYCADGKQRFLVYEYMRKGNLQDHLNGELVRIKERGFSFNTAFILLSQRRMFLQESCK